jgi:inorganic triphosphatase YgiF
MGSNKRRTEEQLARDEPREIEMKLALDPAAIETLLRHPWIGAARKARADRLYAIYYDTPEQDLRQAGLSLRVRRQGDGWVQTLKADGGTRSLLLDRSEWETPVPDRQLDWRALEGTAIAPLLASDKSLKDHVQPAFTVETARHSFDLDRDGSSIELVVDRAEVASGERTYCFGEIELEVKRGKPNAVFGLALDLAAAAPVRLSLATKSARGYALLDGGAAPQPDKAERIRLEPGTASAQALQAIARSCLSQAVQNEAILREHRLPGAVHQFRVGLRRLRAAASLFRDLIADEESRRIRAELRWMNHSLGPLRDLDVLIERLRASPDPGPSLEAAERRREEAYDELLARLDEPRFRGATLATAAWIETGSWLTDEDLAARRDEPIEQRAADALSKRWKRVLKRAKPLAELEPDARHEVRIEIKKLRYGVEFFGPLFSGNKAKKRRKRALACLEQLQEVLGELNDIAVGGHLLRPPSAPALEGAAPAEPDDESVDDLLRRARRTYDELAATKRFWN